MKTKSYENNYSNFIKKDIALSSDFSNYFIRHEDTETVSGTVFQQPKKEEKSQIEIKEIKF